MSRTRRARRAAETRQRAARIRELFEKTRGLPDDPPYRIGAGDEGPSDELDPDMARVNVLEFGGA